MLSRSMTNQGLRTRVWAWMCILIVSDAYGPAYATDALRTTLLDTTRQVNNNI